MKHICTLSSTTMKKVILAGLLGCCPLSIAQAQLLLDDFSTPQSLSAGAAGFVNGSGIYGGDRDVFTDGLSFEATGGTANVTGVTGTGSRLELSYDGANSTLTRMLGLTPVDFPVTGDRFAFDVLSISGTVDLSQVILISSGTGFDRQFLETPIPITGPGLFELTLSQVAGTVGTPNLSDIRQIIFAFQFDTGESIEMDNLRIVVPEPSSFGLFGIAGITAAGSCWRRRKRAA